MGALHDYWPTKSPSLEEYFEIAKEAHEKDEPIPHPLTQIPEKK